MPQVLNILDESEALCLKHLALSNVLRTDQRANPLPGSLRDVQAPTAAGSARRPHLKNWRAALILQAEPEGNQTSCSISCSDTIWPLRGFSWTPSSRRAGLAHQDYTQGAFHNPSLCPLQEEEPSLSVSLYPRTAQLLPPIAQGCSHIISCGSSAAKQLPVPPTLPAPGSHQGSVGPHEHREFSQFYLDVCEPFYSITPGLTRYDSASYKPRNCQKQEHLKLHYSRRSGFHVKFNAKIMLKKLQWAAWFPSDNFLMILECSQRIKLPVFQVCSLDMQLLQRSNQTRALRFSTPSAGSITCTT